MSAAENKSSQSSGAARVDGTVLSSKRAKKVFSLSGSKTSVWLVFPWLSVDPATYVLCLSRWIGTPLCLCTDSVMDCHTEDITGLFVFNHIPSPLALVKCSVLHSQFSAKDAYVFVFVLFLFWIGFNRHVGYNIPYIPPDDLSHCVSI